jgi:hypothetical protein
MNFTDCVQGTASMETEAPGGIQPRVRPIKAAALPKLIPDC